MEKDIINLFSKLISYGISTELITKNDVTYVFNQLLDLFKINEPLEYDIAIDNEITELEDILDKLLDYAFEKNLFPENTLTQRDLFDVRIMNTMVKRPSEVISEFWELYKKAPKIATDWYYKFSADTDYIRRYRIRKDLKWVVNTEYGDIDITINLSKPEKDPKAIAKAKTMHQSSYPKCLLCKENEGYAGRINHPNRLNHRIIPITIDNCDWFLQYSSYVYYNEHCIVFNSKHIPMVIDSSTFRKLFDFLKLFPHYMIGSNADLPIVGGSILSHEHFQGGNYCFALNRAEIEESFSLNSFPKVECGIVKWPMSVIRLKSANSDKLIELSTHILEKWQKYTDEDCFIYAETGGEKHNTITPIALFKDGMYVIDLVLRNNITTKEHPLGVFHPHENLHHIKKENIGLIEVLGLAILPSRLKKEIAILKDAILSKKDIKAIPEIAKHDAWVKEFSQKYSSINSENIDSILQEEIGLVFLEVLKNAGVFKRDEKGKNGFERFIATL